MKKFYSLMIINLITSIIPQPLKTFKEALHNIYRHANADQVTVKMDMENQTQLAIEIHDNGIGFDPVVKNSGLGMNSMRNRMKGIGGEFSLSSDLRGTSIRFVYPLKSFSPLLLPHSGDAFS